MAASLSHTKPPLAWSVIGTLAWYGLRHRPLSVSEITRLLLKQSASEEDVKGVLERDERVEFHRGLYSLTGDEVYYPDPAKERLVRYKWWRLQMGLNILRHVPYVRLIGVLQTLADKTASRDSDIDVLIVIEHGRLYLTRTLITGLLQLMGLRRHGTHITDRICLSWFATTNHLDMHPVTFKPYDPLLFFLFSEMVPVLDDRGTYQEFVRKNRWIKNFIPQYGPRVAKPCRPSRIAKMGERFLSGMVGSWLEQRIRRWQQNRIAHNPTNPNPDVKIIATESMLKFHEKERRRVDREAWEARMQELGENPELILA